ncbi:MAG: response regulator, partial [Lachnospiraceae bacterium]
MFSILLVEDEKLELETLRDYVDWKKLGASRVYTARNGRTALECLEEHDPDIMITDIQLPVMNGIELSKRAREEGFGCKIVFLTGYDNFEYMKSAFQVQAVDYILKPFRVD